MWYALGWMVVGVLMALWSLLAWVVHAAAAWGLTLAGDSSVWVAGAALVPQAWAAWIGPELTAWLEQAVAALQPVVAAVLQAAPALAGIASVVIWFVWGLGALALVLVGVALHIGIAFWRRREFGHGAWSASSALLPGKLAGLYQLYRHVRTVLR